MPLHIVLYQPEIPPNTGNIIRLCANCGAELHLIAPMGFTLDDKRLRRAGLDYHEFAQVKQWADLDAYRKAYSTRRLVAVGTQGQYFYSQFSFGPADSLLFGSETRGLPQDILQSLLPEHLVRLPMLVGSRSLNLSNAVAVVAYEAWRQLGFDRGE